MNIAHSKDLWAILFGSLRKALIFAGMKWASFMLCIYFMLLIVMPRSDGEECNAPIQRKSCCFRDMGKKMGACRQISPNFEMKIEVRIENFEKLRLQDAHD
jgi:hypothetical protein